MTRPNKGRPSRGDRERHFNDPSRNPGTQSRSRGANTEKSGAGRSVARQYGLEGKSIMVPAEEWFELTHAGLPSALRGGRDNTEKKGILPEADILARENVELLEENARLQQEIASLKNQVGAEPPAAKREEEGRQSEEKSAGTGRYDTCQSELDVHRRLLRWLSSSGRTGNFIWLGIRDLVRADRMDEALELAEEKIEKFSG